MFLAYGEWFLRKPSSVWKCILCDSTIYKANRHWPECSFKELYQSKVNSSKVLAFVNHIVLEIHPLYTNCRHTMAVTSKWVEHWTFKNGGPKFESYCCWTQQKNVLLPQQLITINCWYPWSASSLIKTDSRNSCY